MLKEIRRPGPPIDGRELITFTTLYDLTLPRAYREFILKNNGGRPVPAAFPIEGLLGNPVGVVQAFFGLNTTIKTEDLNLVMIDLLGKVPRGIFPFARTDGDDFVCFDLRKAEAPVIFWNRKPFWGNNEWNENDLYPVASNFEHFLAELHDFRP
jgi:hypothetical protein